MEGALGLMQTPLGQARIDGRPAPPGRIGAAGYPVTGTAVKNQLMGGGCTPAPIRLFPDDDAQETTSSDTTTGITKERECEAEARSGCSCRLREQYCAFRDVTARDVECSDIVEERRCIEAERARHVGHAVRHDGEEQRGQCDERASQRGQRRIELARTRRV